MLYRLDRICEGGEIPITDLLGPVLIRRYSWARARALVAAAQDPDGCVRIRRIGNSGQLSDAADVYPDGRVVRI